MHLNTQCWLAYCFNHPKHKNVLILVLVAALFVLGYQSLYSGVI
jgi:hypothetical protein